MADGPLVAVTDGQPYNLTCIATGSKPAVTIIWLKNNVEVSIAVCSRDVSALHTAIPICYFVATGCDEI